MGSELWENGTQSKVEIHKCVNDQNDKLHVLGRASWGRSPPRLKSQMLFTVRHESRRCKFVKMLKRCAASFGVNPEIRGPQNKGKRI